MDSSNSYTPDRSKRPHQSEEEKSKSPQNSPLFENKSLQDSLSSLYKPPYSASNHGYFERMDSSDDYESSDYLHTQNTSNRDLHEALSQPSSFSQQRQILEKTAADQTYEDEYRVKEKKASNAIEEDSEDVKKSFWTISALSVGANLAVIGLLQLLFSTNGKLTLQWDARYWFIYCIAACPLLFLGFKKVRSFKN